MVVKMAASSTGMDTPLLNNPCSSGNSESDEDVVDKAREDREVASLLGHLRNPTPADIVRSRKIRLPVGSQPAEEL